MNDSKALAAEHIHTLHHWIHQVFTDASGEGRAVIPRLLAAFDAQFTMVTQQGAVIKLPQLSQLFNTSLGRRPELAIVIEDVVPFSEHNGVVTIRYREIHREAALTAERISTAIIDTTGEQVRWLYLHETPCA
ncbi:hypothetical protein EDC56_0930 [Sinobacterium caligoides]|uniref:DUF4440 domain-containing protein n=1 Tax=Sinobacterium caligoides TaxID=933926 RepID=A0A3N2DZY5_9GAMM|nr:hypothetical protein [Sinobacterium caligoides]ROS05400.1 hypothetical protein EDC56_0930 [Sinobacterium caligoides]